MRVAPELTGREVELLGMVMRGFEGCAPAMAGEHATAAEIEAVAASVRGALPAPLDLTEREADVLSMLARGAAKCTAAIVEGTDYEGHELTAALGSLMAAVQDGYDRDKGGRA